MFTLSPDLALPTDPDLLLVEQLIARLPVEVMERLARRHFTLSALQRRRLAERDAAIRRLAIGRLGSGRELAKDIGKDLGRYAASGFRFERDQPPEDPRRRQLHRVLTLNGGRVPADRTIRAALAGIRPGQNSPPEPAHSRAYLVRNGKARRPEHARVAEGDQRSRRDKGARGADRGRAAQGR